MASFLLVPTKHTNSCKKKIFRVMSWILQADKKKIPHSPGGVDWVIPLRMEWQQHNGNQINGFIINRRKSWEQKHMPTAMISKIWLSTVVHKPEWPVWKEYVRIVMGKGPWPITTIRKPTADIVKAVFLNNLPGGPSIWRPCSRVHCISRAGLPTIDALEAGVSEALPLLSYR